MKLSKLFAQEHGTQALLAKTMDIPASMLSQWASGARQTPIDRCVAIERATGGAVTRRDLRPDDWHLIWPELVAVDDSINQPQSTATIAPAATKPIAHTPYETALLDAMMPVLMVSKHEKPGDRRSESHPPEADLERRENEAAALVRVEEEAAKNAKKG